MIREHARILPAALQPGDLVSVVAPASRPDQIGLEAGVETLRARGLRVRVEAHVLDTYGSLAGSDRDRAADLMGAFLDPEVRGIFCARGGSGSARLIPYLDFPAIAAQPKVFVGYSDVTVLHLALARHAGWPTFYGPMVASEMDGSMEAACLDALCDLITCPGPAGALNSRRVPALVGGVAEGIMTGGTLCLVDASIGTGYAADVAGKILALEDSHESAWRVDRMLTHLDHAGLLDAAAGFLIGSLVEPEEHGGGSDPLTEEQCLRDHLLPLGKPVLYGFPFGHIVSPLTLPLNCGVRLDADSGVLTILEPAVAPRA